MSYHHIRVKFLEPQQWWRQGWDRPAEGQYAIVNTSDKYVHPRHCPLPADRIIEGPFVQYEHAEAVRARMVEEWEDQDYMDEVELGEQEDA